MHFSLIVVGAHDGSKAASTISAAAAKGQVLLIEPVSWLFDRLCRKYEGLKNVALCRCAISTSDGVATFYAPHESANDIAPWGDQLGSLNPSHAQAHDLRFMEKMSAVTVRTTSIRTLIETYEISSIDMLIMDTEGHDTKILVDFPFERIKPRQICFEHKHSDGVFNIGPNFARIITLLHAQNYGLRIVDAENCWATLKG